ncbi:hypothetical protein EDB81DRAFT_885175 [Dactylonectria macrodidyma]|uniref:Uncharacterized protein n=1 Tax=Dactylonectria macrodidyma TaxID=307937 RepID=A0A9P9ES46_9HYPO|nr:hypothetical protein EDB81DRAFT_885175 [Dactylonectria macrodidyma]
MNPLGPCLSLTWLHLQKHYSSSAELTHVLETLLDYLMEFDVQEIDILDTDGATALLEADDFTSPEVIEFLLDWGADPSSRRSLRPVFSASSVLGYLKFGRAQFSLQFTRYEFVIFQLFNEHMHRFTRTMLIMSSNVINKALLVSDFPDQRFALLLRRFHTLTMLSSPGGSVTKTELWPLRRRSYGTHGEWPCTENQATARRACGRIELELYLDIWGPHTLNHSNSPSMERTSIYWSIQVSPLNAEVTTSEMLAKVCYYERILDTQGMPVIRYTHSIGDTHSYRFPVEYTRLEDGTKRRAWLALTPSSSGRL